MSGFNWEAFGPAGNEPSEGAALESDRGDRREQPRPSQNWDFVLGGDDAGLSTEAMSGQLEEFLAAARDAQSSAAAVTRDAWDSDHLVHITVNSAGVVISTRFDADALRRSSPRSLAAAVTEAAQAAASAAMSAVEDHLTPLLDGIDQLDETVPDSPGTPDVNALFDEARQNQRRLYHDPVPPAGGDDTSYDHPPKRGPDHER